jgi:hypothetical protein
MRENRSPASHLRCRVFPVSGDDRRSVFFASRGREKETPRDGYRCAPPMLRTEIAVQIVVASASEAIHLTEERKNGLLRRDRSSQRRRNDRPTLRNPHVMGIAALHPSYRLLISFLNRDAVGWVEHLRNPSPRRFAFDYNFEPTRGPAVMRGLL